MLNEALNYLSYQRRLPNVLDFGDSGVVSAGLVLNSKTFDSTDRTRRPPGWRELRARRTHYKQRVLGADTDPAMEAIREKEVF
jgi:hypothetical protein